METRASTRKALGTRRQILDAALELFSTRGFERTTMREIADQAGLAVGATYYYFKNKESLVLAFYADTQQAAEEHLRETLSAAPDFKSCIGDVIWHRLTLLDPYRPFITVLAEHLSPTDVVSPFGPATRDLRERSIALMAEAVEGVRLKTSKSIRPHLPLLLWLYQMGITFFWIHDRSKDQRRTRQLLDESLDVLHLALRMARSPLFRKLGRGMRQIMEIIAEVVR